MRKLVARPATVIVERAPGVRDVVACLEAWVTDERETPMTIEMHGQDDIRFIDVDAGTATEVPGFITGKTLPGGYDLTVRAVEPADSSEIPGLPDFPIPSVVTAAILSGENMDAHLEALTEDDGFVSTLLLVTDVGLFVRYSGTWIRLVDVALIDGLNSTKVDASALDVYDAADRTNAMLPLGALTTLENNGGSTGELFVAANASRTFVNPVTAAMATIPVQIETVRDLPRAIEAAASDESIRWYVERRGRALDPEVKFPWEEAQSGADDAAE